MVDYLCVCFAVKIIVFDFVQILHRYENDSTSTKSYNYSITG